MKKKMAQGKAGLAPIWSRKKRNQSKVPSRKANGIFFIRVLDDRYQTFVNKVPITDFEFNGVSSSGHIGLQVHGVKRPELVGKKVRFRNIFLRKLKSVEEQLEDAESTSPTVLPPKVEPAFTLSGYIQG